MPSPLPAVFPPNYLFSPHPGSFLRRKHPFCAPGGTPGCRHPLCPHSASGVGFSTLPYKCGGMRRPFHVPPTGTGSLMGGGAESMFCSPKLLGSRGGVLGAGNCFSAPSRVSNRVGKRPPAGDMRSRGTLLAQTPETGDGFSLFFFSSIFHVPSQVWTAQIILGGSRDEVLQGVNSEGQILVVLTCPPSRQGPSHLCSSEFYQSIKLQPQPCHHSAPELTPSSAQPPST